MKKVSKNNKGFSLVELIVVVLIMAIIAVSLAPQVMKWVDRSRQANDASNYDALYAAAQLSVISAPASAGNIVLTMSSGGTAATGGDSTTLDAFKNAMASNLPGYTDIEITSTATAVNYVITISGTQVIKGALDASGDVIVDASNNIVNAPGEIATN